MLNAYLALPFGRKQISVMNAKPTLRTKFKSYRHCNARLDRHGEELRDLPGNVVMKADFSCSALQCTG